MRRGTANFTPTKKLSALLPKHNKWRSSPNTKVVTRSQILKADIDHALAHLTPHIHRKTNYGEACRESEGKSVLQNFLLGNFMTQPFFQGGKFSTHGYASMDLADPIKFCMSVFFLSLVSILKTPGWETMLESSSSNSLFSRFHTVYIER